MNLYHRWLCRSAGWAEFVAGSLLPQSLRGVDLGDRVLELGPGYGASTRPLIGLVPKLVVLEPDPALVPGLRHEFGDAIEVVQGDATNSPFTDATFSAVVCFTMLHHLPSEEAQDRLFAEVARVLRPGGVFIARDAGRGWRFRLIHLLDVCTPLSPDGLRARLDGAGLLVTDIQYSRRHVLVLAQRPPGVGHGTRRDANHDGSRPRPSSGAGDA